MKGERLVVGVPNAERAEKPKMAQTPTQSSGERKEKDVNESRYVVHAKTIGMVTSESRAMLAQTLILAS